MLEATAVTASQLALFLPQPAIAASPVRPTPPNFAVRVIAYQSMLSTGPEPPCRLLQLLSCFHQAGRMKDVGSTVFMAAS